MDMNKLLNRVDALEKQIAHSRNGDVKTKYQTISLFRELKKVIQYRIPTEPINVENDGQLFECPRCKTKFETELNYISSDFTCCPSCGQLFKEVRDEEISN